MTKEKPYGFELILDLHDCDVTMFNRESLRNYFIKICKAIDMKRCALHFWDDLNVPEKEKQTPPPHKRNFCCSIYFNQQYHHPYLRYPKIGLCKYFFLQAF